MNSLDPSWNRLTAAARDAAARDVAPSASAAWVTRVAALGLAEYRRYREQWAWASWAMPGLGIATLVAVVAVVAWGGGISEPNGGAELVALADPLAGNSLLP